MSGIRINSERNVITILSYYALNNFAFPSIEINLVYITVTIFCHPRFVSIEGNFDAIVLVLDDRNV